MEFIIKNIILSHIIVIILIFIIYLIELKTPIRSIFYVFKYKKTLENATAFADFFSVVYFVFCLLIHLFSCYSIQKIPDDYSFWIWIIIMLPLAILFNKFLYKFTNKDPNLNDDGWSEKIK